jgi:hypothetical protein
MASLASGLQAWFAPLGMGAAPEAPQPKAPKWALDGRVIRAAESPAAK